MQSNKKYKEWHTKLIQLQKSASSSNQEHAIRAATLIKRYNAKITRWIREESKRQQKKSIKRHQKAAHLSRKLTSALKGIDTTALKTNIDAEKRRRHFQHWITKIRQAFDLYPQTAAIFSKFDAKGKVQRPDDKETNMAVYNVLVNYLDSLTIKSMQHHYPDGISLLRDLINLCNADSDEVGDELKRDFDIMKIGSTETGSNFIIRLKAKANDARYHLKPISDEEIYKKIVRGIGKTHQDYGSLIMTHESLPSRKHTLRKLEKAMSDFDRERHLALPSKREFAANTKTQSSRFGRQQMTTDTRKTGTLHQGHCPHCGFYGHKEDKCRIKKLGRPKATEAERKKRQL
ncbi:MAG: hypothetical protein ACRDL7_12095, partial [Gaiellaceae bacterium]